MHDLDDRAREAEGADWREPACGWCGSGLVGGACPRCTEPPEERGKVNPLRVMFWLAFGFYGSLGLAWALWPTPAEPASITWVRDCDAEGRNCATIGYSGEWADPRRPGVATGAKGGALPETPHSLGDYWFTCPPWEGMPWVMLTEVICGSPLSGDPLHVAAEPERPPLWLSCGCTPDEKGSPPDPPFRPPFHPRPPAPQPPPPSEHPSPAPLPSPWALLGGAVAAVLAGPAVSALFRRIRPVAQEPAP